VYIFLGQKKDFDLICVLVVTEKRRNKNTCVKHRAKMEIKSSKKIMSKNGRPDTQGVCPVCRTKVFRIGG